MSGKKGKDIATSMILDDLLDESETSDLPLNEEDFEGSLVLDDSRYYDLKESEESPHAQKQSKSSAELDPENKAFEEENLQMESESEAEAESDKDFHPSAESGHKGLTSTQANDRTLQLNESQIANFSALEKLATKDKGFNHKTLVLPERSGLASSSLPESASGSEEARRSVGRFSSSPSGTGMQPVVASLAQSENLRIAQNRILELEQRLEALRTENMDLATAGEIVRKKVDELRAKSDSAEKKYSLDISSLQNERDFLKASLDARDQEILNLKDQLEEMDVRLKSTLQKVRVRERELENRLELVKMESSAIIHNKDEFLLELKRQMDQLNMETDNYRNKTHELNRQLAEKQELLRRTVKALRLSLTMLEGSEDSSTKKVT